MTELDERVHEIAELLVAHTRMSIEGQCHCGEKIRLGTSFAVHQAEAITAARATRPVRVRII